MPRLADSRARAALTLLAALSGCCALAYEILYMRGLTTLLGDMLYVHAALLSTFLVGIALGARLARHFVGWLWLLEVLTGVYALAQPWLQRVLGQQELLAAITASPTLTIGCTILFVCLPGILIGFSIPLFSAYVKEHDPEGLAFQGIYVAYNLGALLSILAVELLLVRRLGVSVSLAVIGAINIANGVALLWMRERGQKLAAASLGERIRVPLQVVTALFIASVVSATFQMFFLKLTYLVFHPHRENFAVGLSVTMFGIFLGAWLARRVAVTFTTLMLLLPVCLGTIYAAYEPILRLHQATEDRFNASELLVLLHKFGVGSLFALVPMVLFGATLPALMRRERRVAAEAGQLLFVSSMANATGYLLYVTVGHPWFGGGTLLALLGVAAILAAGLAQGFRLSRPQWALAGLGIVALVGMAALWQDRNFYLAQWVDDLGPADEVRVFKSGAESASLVRESNGKYEWVSYNGHPSIEVQFDGRVNLAETISGVIPALGAPRLERALVLGLGTGITAGATASIFDHTDVVEINDAFYEMMPHLAHANLAIGDNSAASLHLSDGRAFLVGKDARYDAIVNSIPAPTYYSASKIYTVEFYQRVAAALKPDGVFCGWLSSENMGERGLETVLDAIHQSFRYCDLRVMTRTYYMATCANRPIETRGFRELPATFDLVDQIQNAVPGFDLTEFFESIRVSDNIFERYTPAPARSNTDDHPILEFMVVRDYQLGQMGEDPFVMRQSEMNVDVLGQRKAASLARHAAILAFVRAEHFETDVLPALREDAAAREIWLDWGFDAP